MVYNMVYNMVAFSRRRSSGTREHNAEWGKGCDHSWNFYGGLGLTVEF